MFASHIATISQINDSADIINKYIRDQIYEYFYTPIADGDFDTFADNYKKLMVDKYPLPGIDYSECAEIEQVTLYKNISDLLAYLRLRKSLDVMIASWLGQIENMYVLHLKAKEKEQCEQKKAGADLAKTNMIGKISVSVSVDIKYLLYIKLYGPPINGIFDPVKLANISTGEVGENTQLACIKCHSCECECDK